MVSKKLDDAFFSVVYMSHTIVFYFGQQQMSLKESCPLFSSILERNGIVGDSRDMFLRLLAHWVRGTVYVGEHRLRRQLVILGSVDSKPTGLSTLVDFIRELCDGDDTFLFCHSPARSFNRKRTNKRTITIDETGAVDLGLLPFAAGYHISGTMIPRHVDLIMGGVVCNVPNEKPWDRQVIKEWKLPGMIVSKLPWVYSWPYTLGIPYDDGCVHPTILINRRIHTVRIDQPLEQMNCEFPTHLAAERPALLAILNACF
jgi:hypothetical protein